ncbi:MAG: tRNA (cytidine(34)-2'-O)-methyltransferase [Gammaproteobacteria bacterium]|nr:tRNA (cytidine(34)-2'-O)-methyltransferase [Gammaproteobacteria bacterium]
MFNIVLYEPEIPPNTGNIIRLCANTGCRLHLVEPLGFSLEEKALRRAGLDYHEYADVLRYPDYKGFVDQCLADNPSARLIAFSTKATEAYSSKSYLPDDFLLFGPETRGLPDTLLATLSPGQLARLPMLPGSRSLNLSNTVAVVVYEAWRQQQFAGAIDTLTR